MLGRRHPAHLYFKTSQVQMAAELTAKSRSMEMLDEKTTYIVHGFIHEMENIYELSTIMPVSIIEICILFYAQIEWFLKCSKELVIEGIKKDQITNKRMTLDSYENVGCGAKD